MTEPRPDTDAMAPGGLVKPDRTYLVGEGGCNLPSLSTDAVQAEIARITEEWRAGIARQAVETFAADLRDGLDQLPRDDPYGTLIRPGDVADLVVRLVREAKVTNTKIGD
jgi:hypothetical protein